MNTTEDVDLKRNDGDILESATSGFDLSYAALNVVVMNPEPVPSSRESGTTEHTLGSGRLEHSHHPQVRVSFAIVVPRLDMKGPVANAHLYTIEENGRRMTTRQIEPHVSKPSLRSGDFNESAMKCVRVDHLKEWSWLLVGGLGSVKDDCQLRDEVSALGVKLTVIRLLHIDALNVVDEGGH